MGNKTKIVRTSIDRSYRTVGCFAITDTRDILRFTFNNTRTGSDDPLWKTKISLGLNATNPMTVIAMQLRHKPGVFFYTYNHPNAVCRTNNGKTSYELNCGLPIDLPTHNAWDASLKSDAQNKAAIGIRQRIRSESTKFSGMTFLGELRESLKMLRNPAKALMSYTTDYLRRMSRHKSKQSKKTFEKTLADSWLEFSFGWAPLAGDIQSIAEAAQILARDTSIKRISFTGVAESAVSTGNTGTSVFGHTLSFATDYIDRCKAIYTAGFKPEALESNGALDSVIAHGGFNLNEIIPTAWNLLPWSFFIDYFSNIGAVLESSLVDMSGVRWSKLTTIEEKIISRHSLKVITQSSSFQDFTGGLPSSYVATSKRITRSAVTIAYPQLRFELPGSNTQFLNIGALAISQFQKS